MRPALSLVLFLAAGPSISGPKPPPVGTQFETHRAQVVMLADRGPLPGEQADRIVAALQSLASEADATGAARPESDLDLDAPRRAGRP